MNYDLLKRLSEAPGVPGREEHIRELLTRELEGAVDSLEADTMGNLIAVKKGKKKGKRVMVSAHMDEIGFYVRFIDDNGFLRVQNLGGFDTRTLFARQVTVHAASGDALLGVMNPAVKPVHIASSEDRKQVPELAEFMIDTGLDADTVQAKVRLGDPVTLRQPFADLGAVVTGKALDDRVNCFILTELLKTVKPAHDIYAVFSVQEEVGLRGAQTAAYALEPEIGIALDTTLAVDIPGTPTEQRVTKLGDGVALKVMDSSMISTRWLLDEFVALAEQHAVPYQFELLPLGGTDAGAIQRSRGGVATLTLSIPSRYVHTVTEMVAKRDVEASLALLTYHLG